MTNNEAEDSYGSVNIVRTTCHARPL